MRWRRNGVRPRNWAVQWGTVRMLGVFLTDEMCARLSPIQYNHINFLGRYSFSRADVAAGLRPFHELPSSAADGAGAPPAWGGKTPRPAGDTQPESTLAMC
ncbi:hypothetical protein [Microtetraspora malaysiensis]|uniref:hypothetical protein n=1 Tax=Microtetraspora malaysiensis TaxID=161358 RepID=UPI003D8C93DC